MRNSIKHAPAGTMVEARLEREGHVAVVTVRDRGLIMPEKPPAAISEPFVRIEVDRGRASGGFGFGLSIAKQAVELHGG